MNGHSFDQTSAQAEVNADPHHGQNRLPDGASDLQEGQFIGPTLYDKAMAHAVRRGPTLLSAFMAIP